MHGPSRCITRLATRVASNSYSSLGRADLSDALAARVQTISNECVGTPNMAL